MKNLKIFLFVPLLLILLGAFSGPVEANLIDGVKGFVQVGKFVTDLTNEKGQHSSRLMENLLYSTTYNAAGVVAPEILDQETQQRLKEGGHASLTGIVDNQVITMFQSQPRIDVIAHLADEWVPGHKESTSVYASGFQDLQRSGIQPIWNFMRNIAYLGFVVIMIIVGFMIMFRHKIGGQMMVTVGNTLPRVVVSLILVTFSFAIMGLILDFAGVLMNLTVAVLGGIKIHNVGMLLVGTLGQTGLGGLGIGAIAAAILFMFLNPIAWIIVGIMLIVVGFIIWGAIKLWFALVKSYFALLINVITAPIVLMIGALPGNSAAIGNLFKSALRNALVFPVAYAIVNLPFFLVEGMGEDKVNLAFPSTLLNVDETANLEVSAFFLALAKLVAIYVAAQTPEFMKAIIPATASRSGADVAGAIKAGLGKVPLLGGFIGK